MRRKAPEMRQPATCSKHTHHTYYILENTGRTVFFRTNTHTISMKIPDVRYFSEQTHNTYYIHENTGRTVLFRTYAHSTIYPYKYRTFSEQNPFKYRTYGTFSEYTHHMCTYHTCTSTGRTVLFRTYAHYKYYIDIHKNTGHTVFFRTNSPHILYSRKYRTYGTFLEHV